MVVSFVLIVEVNKFCIFFIMRRVRESRDLFKSILIKVWIVVLFINLLILRIIVVNGVFVDNFFFSVLVYVLFYLVVSVNIIVVKVWLVVKFFLVILVILGGMLCNILRKKYVNVELVLYSFLYNVVVSEVVILLLEMLIILKGKDEIKVFLKVFILLFFREFVLSRERLSGSCNCEKVLYVFKISKMFFG